MSTPAQFRRRRLDGFLRFRSRAKLWRASSLAFCIVLGLAFCLFLPRAWAAGSLIGLSFIAWLFMELGHIHFRCPMCDEVIDDTDSLHTLPDKCPVCGTTFK